MILINHLPIYFPYITAIAIAFHINHMKLPSPSTSYEVPNIEHLISYHCMHEVPNLEHLISYLCMWRLYDILASLVDSVSYFVPREKEPWERGKLGNNRSRYLFFNPRANYGTQICDFWMWNWNWPKRQTFSNVWSEIFTNIHLLMWWIRACEKIMKYGDSSSTSLKLSLLISVFFKEILRIISTQEKVGINMRRHIQQVLYHIS